MRRPSENVSLDDMPCRFTIARSCISTKALNALRVIGFATAVVVLPTALHSSAFGADETITPRQMEIVGRVSGVDGFLTQAMHEAFWAAMPDVVKTEVARNPRFRAKVHGSLLAKGQFEAEAWRSIGASLAAGKPVRNENYLAAVRKFRTGYREIGREGEAEKEIRTVDSIIQAVAEGRPFKTGEDEFVFTAEHIEEFSSAANAALVRNLALLDPEWPSHPVARFYPDAQVYIASHFPFHVEYGDPSDHLETPSVQRAVEHLLDAVGSTKTKSYVQRVDEDGQVSVSYHALSSRLERPEETLELIATTLAKLGGLTESGTSHTDWRARPSVVLNGRITEDGTTFSVSQRFVDLPDKPGVLLFYAFTQESPATAMSLREQLENSVRINE